MNGHCTSKEISHRLLSLQYIIQIFSDWFSLDVPGVIVRSVALFILDGGVSPFHEKEPYWFGRVLGLKLSDGKVQRSVSIHVLDIDIRLHGKYVVN